MTIGGVVLAATIPIVFLHLRYQPAVTLHAGGASETFKLSDAMVLLTAVAALVSVRRHGARVLRPGLAVWITALLFLGWIAIATFYPLLSHRSYAWKTHLVTAAEFCEYALLAPAVVVLLRRRADALLVVAALLAWTTVAVVIGVVQWAGWTGLHGWGRGHRQPSLLGPHEFAALSALTLGVGLVVLVLRVEERRVRAVAWFAIVVGIVGFVLGGATAGIVGLVPAAVLVGWIGVRRRTADRRVLAGALAAAAIASVGVVALRAGDFGEFFRFLGLRPLNHASSTNVQTYPQRTMLAYIGLRIWIHHPILGVGWQGSNEVSGFGPELPAAHKRFPHVSPTSFPSAQHPYGVQILYLQALDDLGIFGFAFLVALIVAALMVGLRAAVRAPPDAALAATIGIVWIVTLLGFWLAQGLVAGIPLDAMTWLAFGTVALRPYSQA
ncbi:MAG TPA: O-antigen ligase family protein [Gaiellaceae bacterium]|nr:O-antigen ligase family protein [Gaiellaceae bacterium]